MAYRILHLSDIHTGPPFRAAVAEQLVAEAQALAPDLVVISGDFVQRADFPGQWRDANALRARLPQPQLAVAGNHDVPLFNVPLRLLSPLGSYRRHISRDLNPIFSRPGLVVVGACTAHGLTVDGGRLSAGQARALRAALAPHGAEVYKVVVWHHPVAMPPECGHRRRELRGAPAAMRLLDELGVDMLLCGHLHVGYVGDTRDHLPALRRGTYIVQSGTSTSRRGHGSEHRANSCNLITIDAGAAHVQRLRFDPAAGRFLPAAEHALPRRSALSAGR